jgi:hypothetical protein
VDRDIDNGMSQLAQTLTAAFLPSITQPATTPRLRGVPVNRSKSRYKEHVKWSFDYKQLWEREGACTAVQVNLSHMEEGSMRTITKIVVTCLLSAPVMGALALPASATVQPQGVPIVQLHVASNVQPQGTANVAPHAQP